MSTFVGLAVVGPIIGFLLITMGVGTYQRRPRLTPIRVAVQKQYRS